jgi:hypothetical protein
MLVAAVLLGFAILMTTALTRAEDEDQPGASTKAVMKRVFKGPLNRKVAGGKASEKEKKELLELFQALAKNKPPRGDAESWKKKNAALVSAAKAMIKGEKDAGKALTKAANCKNCHSKHKPPKK